MWTKEFALIKIWNKKRIGVVSFYISLTTNKIAAAATTIKITISKLYADCVLVLVLRQDNAQPLYFSSGEFVYGDTTLPVLLNPGRTVQFDEDCTLPSIWIPITNRMLIAMKAPTNPMMVLDSAIWFCFWIIIFKQVSEFTHGIIVRWFAIWLCKQ